MLDLAGLDVLEHVTRNQRYRIHFSKDEIQKHERLLKEIFGKLIENLMVIIRLDKGSNIPPFQNP